MQSKDIATIAVIFNKTNILFQLSINYRYRKLKVHGSTYIKIPWGW